MKHVELGRNRAFAMVGLLIVLGCTPTNKGGSEGVNGPMNQPPSVGTPAGNETSNRPAPTPTTTATIQTASPTTTASGTQVFLVMSGGRGSCGDGRAPESNYMWPHLQAQKKALESKGKRVKWLLSCFGSSDSDVRATTDAAPTEVKSLGQAGYFALLKSFLSNSTDPVGFTGHSYGGWLVMKGVQTIGSTASIRRLTTIDPISTVTCTPANFEKALVQSVINPGQGISNPGCNAAPTDIDSNARTAIRTFAKAWTNYYQEEMRLLHSSAINEATDNRKHGYAGLGDHNKIAKDPAIIAEIATAVGGL